MRLCDSCRLIEVTDESDGPLERRVDARLVVAVPELVDAGEEADAEIALVVARRQPDVRRARAHRERVHGRIESPGLVVEAEPLEHDEREIALLLDRKVAEQARIVHAVGVLGDLRDQRDEAGLELVEDLTDGIGLETFVEVVQQDVVRILVAHAVEAVDVLVRELDVLLQVREEDREVGLLARLDPGGKGDRPGTGQLRAQVG